MESEVPVDVVFEGENIGGAYRIGILVENTVVVEVKSVLNVVDVHEAQLLA